MFNPEFYPTPTNVIQMMLSGENLQGKTVLEPSAGKGDLVDALQTEGANVLACEINNDLCKIVESKCKVIAADFLTVESHQISHVDYIVMNPPFSNADAHILHAYNIAPAGCRIIALCNLQTVENLYTNSRKELKTIIDTYGSFEDLGDCFSESERKTGVNVALVKLQKAGENNNEFEGFFMEDEPETEGEYGVMSYNVVRDLVNRYVGAVKIYDDQLNAAVKMNNLTSGFYSCKMGMEITEGDKPLKRNEFKKEMQKSGWSFIFSKLNMQKYATRGLREDINKFVETQQKTPFTMKNIYHMLTVIVGTHGQRMDKAILEVFDRVTEHHHDNRHNVKGWKTNSHFLVGKKFILPNIVSPAREYSYTSESYNHLKSSYDGIIPDFEKALCFVTGTQYETTEFKEGIKTLNSSINRNTYGEWYNSEFFKYKAYKNGNMHFEFVDEKVWSQFNSRVAKLKGYPLWEAKAQTAYQNRQTGRQETSTTENKTTVKPVILSTIKLKQTA